MMNLQHPQQPTLCPRLTKNQKPTFKGWKIPKKEAHYHEKEMFYNHRNKFKCWEHVP